jgi:WhiB family transcriptional regulator, redox-sensing transcriptional regulator
MNFELAECAKRGVDPEWFYAEDCIKPNRLAIERARSLCAICLIQVECLSYGMKHEDFGMWGGLTSNERTAIKKKL